MFFPSLTLYKIDAYTHNMFNLRFSIFGYPTVLFLKNGTLVARFNREHTLIDLAIFVHECTDLLPSRITQEQYNKLLKLNDIAKPPQEVEQESFLLLSISIAYLVGLALFSLCT
eukprot:TRINITY_DN2053_c0_g1_i10.p2 TRINITY_DN2053_c0_g1~~TRINITY_DN2053_c0_g1_i10.p2  ORF type:complete len:114 (-),score=19.92 TRINITY_DN2053_c0_g1_i10:983-1324(-)